MNVLKISRKKFLRLAALAIFVPFFLIWEKIVERMEKQGSLKNKIILPLEIPPGISFFNSAIIKRNSSEINVYSSKCTHLGCRINKIENGKLICPCHGSEFDLNGNVLKGPASKPLTKLKYSTDPGTKQLVVLDAKQ